MTANTYTRRPVVVRDNEGEARWWFDSLAVIKATGPDTGGQLTVMVITEPPSSEFPRFVSRNYDTAYWVLDGAMEVEVDRVPVEIQSGDLVFVPRGVPQRQSVAASGCRYLLLSMPGGMDRFALAMSQPAGSLTLPSATAEAPPPDRFAALMQEFGLEFVEETES